MLIKPSRHLAITLILSALVLVTIVSVNILFFSSNMHKVTDDESFLSNIGIILWCVTATVCFFAALLLPNDHQQKARQFLVYSGWLNTYIMFDDFLELHDRYFPEYLNIDEKIIYIVLGIAISMLIIRFRQLILKTNYIVFLMALCFFAISIAADGILNSMEIVYGIFILVVVSSINLFILKRSIFKEYLLVVFLITGLCIIFAILQTSTSISYTEYIFEDGAKWLGISSWCSYYSFTAYQFVINSYANGDIKQPTLP